MDKIEKLEKRIDKLEEKVLIQHKRSIANPYAGEASKEVEITDEKE
jgi:hypothetical protein